MTVSFGSLMLRIRIEPTRPCHFMLGGRFAPEENTPIDFLRGEAPLVRKNDCF
jgi:hypothetical protein